MAFSASERSERWVRNIKTEVMPHEKFSVGWDWITMSLQVLTDTYSKASDTKIDTCHRKSQDYFSRTYATTLSRRFPDPRHAIP